MRRLHQPVEMALEQVIAAFWGPFEGFDQGHRRRRIGEELHLQHRLAIFVLGDRIGDDAAANADFSPTISTDEDCTDGDIEGEITIGRHIADGAGIEPARAGLDLVDDLHGAQFGRAGNGAAGEEIFDHRHHIDIGPPPGGNARGHGVQAPIGLDGEKVGDPHTADFGNAAQIIAQQIDDHQVFGPVLGVGRQLGAPLLILGRARTAFERAFHRAGGELATRVGDEELRRPRQHHVISGMYIGAIGHRLALDQAPIQAEGIALKGKIGLER